MKKFEPNERSIVVTAQVHLVVRDDREAWPTCRRILHELADGNWDINVPQQIVFHEEDDGLHAVGVIITPAQIMHCGETNIVADTMTALGMSKSKSA